MDRFACTALACGSRAPAFCASLGDEMISWVPVADVYPFFRISSTASSPLNSADCTPERRPLCQKPPSPITASVRRENIGDTPARLARLIP